MRFSSLVPCIFLLTILIFGGTVVTAQCTECTTLEEALLAPEQVISLQDNGSLNGRRHKKLPENIGAFVNAEIMYISDHTFKKVPESIGQLTKLEELSFAGCKLKTLPDAIYGLTNLKELILLNNAFSEKEKENIRKRVAEEMPGTMLLLN